MQKVSTVLLSTALVDAAYIHEDYNQVCVLFDTCSQSNFITQGFTRYLIKPYTLPETTLSVDAVLELKICSNQHKCQLDLQNWPYFQSLRQTLRVTFLILLTC